MSIVYRMFHLSGVLTKPGHFLLVKGKFPYDSATNPRTLGRLSANIKNPTKY